MAESLDVRPAVAVAAEPAPPPATRSLGRAWLTGTAAVAAMTVASLARQGGAGALDTIYAEDGAIFLSQAVQSSTLETFTTPYAGYLHTVPRLVTELVTLLPPGRYAAGLAVGAALVTALMGWLVFMASGKWFTTLLPRMLVSAVTVVVPVAQEELPNSIANLQWPSLYALFWLLLWAPASLGKRVVAIAATALVALSCVISAALWPLAVWQAYRRRDRFSILLAAVLTAGLAGQAFAMLSGGSDRTTNIDPVHWAPWWAVRAVPPAVIGQRWFGADVDTRWLALAGLAWVLLAALVLVAWKRPGGPRLALAGAAAAFSVAVYAVPTILSGIATPRYGAAPAMLLIAALVALLAPEPEAGWRTPFTLLVVLCAAVWATNLVVPNTRGQGPGWQAELSRAQCRAGERLIPVTPDGEGWHVTLPCP